MRVFNLRNGGFCPERLRCACARDWGACFRANRPDVKTNSVRSAQIPLEAICRLPDEVSLQEIAEKVEFHAAIGQLDRVGATRHGMSLGLTPGFAWPFISCHSPGLCYNARSSYTPMFPQEASERLCAGGCVSRRVPRSLQHERAGAFTLLELLSSSPLSRS